ncbi:MAG: peptide hydrolase [Gaiellaceae bacterium]|nr:MAG: peptide hydrolase [Gaiellaceae bacterium]
MAPARWLRRFRAPVSLLPEWSPHAPDRAVYVSTESGVWQVHAWDVRSGERRQVTDHPIGVVDGFPTLRGEGVVWFQDETGAEAGRWLVARFEGGDEARPFLPELPVGWSEGLAQAPGIVAAALSGEHGFAIHVARDGEPARELLRAPEPLRIGGVDEGGYLRAGLSADGRLLCLEHALHDDLLHPGLRVVVARTGETVADLRDEGLSVTARCWSPRHGDGRIAVSHEREGEERPALWEPESGRFQPLPIASPGPVWAADWWPDASALLLVELLDGRNRLLRYDLASGETSELPSEPGVILKARVRPDGSVWYLHEQGHRPRSVLDERGREVLPLRGAEELPARPYVSWRFRNPHGQEVHGFYVTPDGTGPFPVLMLVHGGPTSLDLDRWQPEVQAYVDAGFVVGMVNYRGSLGYGRAWRDALVGNIGGPELEDVNAGLDDLVARGIADPERAVIAGHSWGGYITLLELGLHPERWRCGVAGVPVADYVASYEDLSPLLQAYDRALLGGKTPAEVPELMRERNPIEHVDRVVAPVLILVGRNDSRCPYRQVLRYVERLRARGHPHELYEFDAGHASFDVEERIRQVATILDFLARHVPGVRVPDA